MKNIKKLFVLVLAVVMCLTAMSVTSLAAGTFEPKVKLNRRYDTTGDKMYITVTTDQPYGAIKATLTFTEGATFKPDNSKFDENAVKSSMYKLSDNTITFAVATDNLTGTTKGSTSWADLCFDLGELKTATFSLSDVSVANNEEQLNTNAISVPSVSITVDNVMNSLGSQYRNASTGVKSALRFGAKLIRNKADNAVEGGTAISCGYIVGYTDKINSVGATIGATLNDEGNLVVNDANAMINVVSTKYLESADAYMVYSVAVTFADDSANLGKNIQVKPYVIYKDASGNKYIAWGDVIENSYNNVKATNELMNKVA